MVCERCARVLDQPINLYRQGYLIFEPVLSFWNIYPKEIYTVIVIAIDLVVSLPYYLHS